MSIARPALNPHIKGRPIVLVPGSIKRFSIPLRRRSSRQAPTDSATFRVCPAPRRPGADLFRDAMETRTSGGHFDIGIEIERRSTVSLASDKGGKGVSRDSTSGLIGRKRHDYGRRQHEGTRLEEESADLSAGSRPRRRDDTRRNPWGRGCPALDSQRFRRVSRKSADGPERLYRVNTRGSCKHKTGLWNVH